MSRCVSVVIAAYNRESMVQDAIRSALAQDPVLREIIVVDDGSTDGTADAARALARTDPRVTVVTQPQAGPSAARNQGCRLASSEWVFFLDSDDLVAADALPDLVHAVPHPTGIEVPYGTQEILGAPPDLQVYSTARLETRSGDLFNSLVVSYQSTIFNGLFPRRLIESIHGFDESIRYYEDNDFALRIAHTARFIAVPRVVYRARMHGDNRHRSFPDLARDQRIRFIERAIALRPASPAREILRRRAVANVWWSFAARRLLDGRPAEARFATLQALALCPWKLGAWRILAQSFRRPGP
ncbi:MAG: glycosyltransferase family 2 protein [Planctomycetota bacterium]|nr:glycosyltransferase family 2 protein [Planctomycetota bacterium]